MGKQKNTELSAEKHFEVKAISKSWTLIKVPAGNLNC